MARTGEEKLAFEYLFAAVNQLGSNNWRAVAIAVRDRPREGDNVAVFERLVRKMDQGSRVGQRFEFRRRGAVMVIDDESAASGAPLERFDPPDGIGPGSGAVESVDRIGGKNRHPA